MRQKKNDLYFDNCPICQATRNADKRGESLTEQQLKDVFAEANAMKDNHEQNTIVEPDDETKKQYTQIINQIDFFHDFMLFMHTLSKRPLTLTKTGSLQLKEINYFGSIFRHDIYHRDEHGQILFAIRTEYEASYLFRIRLLAETKYLTYRRRGELRLSKNGLWFVTKIDALTQYEQILQWYFNRGRWSAIHPFTDTHNQYIADILQNGQQQIWSYLVAKGNEWINLTKFLSGLATFFKLSAKGDTVIPDFTLRKIERITVKDLRMYNLIEYPDVSDKTVSFRLTELGNYILHKIVTELF